MIQKPDEFVPPCSQCGSRCCLYTAIEIDKPKTKTDYDHIRWYLCHKDVHVFVDHDRKWYVEFRSPCENLTQKKQCTIYRIRPRICRLHGNEEASCEYYASPYLHYFKTRKAFESYLEKQEVNWKFKDH